MLLIYKAEAGSHKRKLHVPAATALRIQQFMQLRQSRQFSKDGQLILEFESMLSDIGMSKCEYAALIMQYENLNDATYNVSGDFFKAGNVEIWYFKDEYARDYCLNFQNSTTTRNHLLPNNREDLTKTHVKLGTVTVKPVQRRNYADEVMEGTYVDLNVVFDMMQGELWSPLGEASDFILGLGISHTSMSVGDIIVVDGRINMVAPLGFTKLS